MNIVKTLVVIAIAGFATQSAHAQLIDDFESGDFPPTPRT